MNKSLFYVERCVRMHIGGVTAERIAKCTGYSIWTVYPLLRQLKRYKMINGTRHGQQQIVWTHANSDSQALCHPHP